MIQVFDVRADSDTLTVVLSDGRSISAPLAWYPRLHSATHNQLANWLPCAGGEGVHWPDLDEDVSVAMMLSSPTN